MRHLPTEVLLSRGVVQIHISTIAEPSTAAFLVAALEGLYPATISSINPGSVHVACFGKSTGLLLPLLNPYSVRLYYQTIRVPGIRQISTVDVVK